MHGKNTSSPDFGTADGLICPLHDPCSREDLKHVILIYVDGYVVHLGRAILKNMKFKNFRFRSFKYGIPPYGMSYEQSVYGEKDRGENYSGYLELVIPSIEYDEMLEKKYGNLSFSEMAPPLDSSIFGPPKGNR